MNCLCDGVVLHYMLEYTYYNLRENDKPETAQTLTMQLNQQEAHISTTPGPGRSVP
jgi:hypothetical protein